MIIIGNFPFRIVEWPEFYAFYQVLNLKIKGNIITAHFEVAKKIRKS